MSQVGVFRLGNMLLGLPATHLREVVPHIELCGVPCESSAVVGGVEVRGQVIPVMDLALAMGRLGTSGEPLTLIMRFRGQVLGMLVDDVLGIIDVPVTESVEDAAGPRDLLQESLLHPDMSSPVHLLCLGYLFGLPGIPLVEEEDHSVIDAVIDGPGDSEGDARSSCGRHMMILRSGNLVMALDSAYVYSTVPSPDLQPSALGGDYCRGVIIFDGRRIAAIDLMQLLGLPHESSSDVQAFVIRMPSGMIAFLVEQIVDVINMSLPACLEVPAFALPRAGFIRGMHPEEVMLSHETVRSKCRASYIFELSGEAIHGSSELDGLARMNVDDDVADKAMSGGDAVDMNVMDVCQVICYDVGYEVVTPMTQIAEILPWHDELQIFGSGKRPNGIVVSRGRAIPTYELCSLLGEPGKGLGSDANILVVEYEGLFMGFIVPKLLSIDRAMWPKARQSREKSVGTESARALDGLGTSSDPVRVGEPDRYRWISMVDLHALTRHLARARFSNDGTARAPLAVAFPSV